MNTIYVHHLDGDRFAVVARDHVFTVDQPLPDGGSDSAPTPTELFVAGLATCVGSYARRFLTRHQLPSEGLTVSADYSVGGSPHRVTEVRVTVGLPGDLPPERLAPLLAMIRHCTVHNSLQQPPDVSISVRHGVMSA